MLDSGLDTLLRLSSVVTLEWRQVKFAQRTIVPLNTKVSTDAKPMSSRLCEALKALSQDGRYVFPQFYTSGETTARHHCMRRFQQLCAFTDVKSGRALDGSRSTACATPGRRGHCNAGPASAR